MSTSRLARSLRHLLSLRRRRYARLIRDSGLFQPEYYLSQLPDPATARRDPVSHYLVHGAVAGLDPNPLFDTSDYAARCPQSASGGKNPLVHFIRTGCGAGVNPGPRFDVGYYLSRYPDVRASGMNPLAHYLAHGAREGRLCFRPEVARPSEHDHSAAVPFRFAAPPSTPPALAVACHLFHPDLAVELRRYLANVPFAFDLFVTTDTAPKKDAIARAFQGCTRGAVTVRICENRGRDIAPKLVALRDVHERYDLVLHLHSKRSDHDPDLAGWRGYLLETLLGSTDIVASVLEAFSLEPRLGIVAAQHFEPIRSWIGWGENLDNARRLARRMGFALDGAAALDFPSGSMFWARSAALRPLLELRLSAADFEPERGQTDGTAAHAIERLYFLACERAGLAWIKIARPDLCPGTPSIAPIDSPDALRRFIAERAVPLTRPGAPAPRKRPPPEAPPSAALARLLNAKALGTGIAGGRRDVVVGIATRDDCSAQLPRLVDSALAALGRAGARPEGPRVFVVDLGTSTASLVGSHPEVAHLGRAADGGSGAAHDRLMREAFARGASLYVTADPDGLFEPDALLALSQMAAAHDDLALVEALRFPVERPKTYSPFTFDTPWASGACLAIPRTVFDIVGGFDASVAPLDDVDLSWRARAAGIPVRICPRALFLQPAEDRPARLDAIRALHAAAVVLARKWGAEAFERASAKQLAALGATPPEARPAPVPAEWRFVADFSHGLDFARVRW